MRRNIKGMGLLLAVSMTVLQPFSAAAAVVPEGAQQTVGAAGTGAPESTAAVTAAETAAPETTSAGAPAVIYAPSKKDKENKTNQGVGVAPDGSSLNGAAEPGTPGAGPGSSGTGTAGTGAENTVTEVGAPNEGAGANAGGTAVSPDGNVTVIGGTNGTATAGGVLPAGYIDQSQLPEGDGTAVADDILNKRPFTITQLVNMDGVVDVYTMKTSLDEGQWNTVGDGFTGMKAHLEEGVGSVYYRIYTKATGWTDWALNDTLTPSTNGARVEAYQMCLQGYTGNLYDIWYTAKLNDGTELGWTNNGKTSGTIGTDKYITAIQVKFWKKGVRFPLNTNNALEAAQYEGMVQDSTGALRYQTADDTPYTGWAYVNNDKYYVKDNVPVTGWQYLDGYKFYFDESGKLVTDLEPIMGNPHDFRIKVNRARNSFTVYTKDGDNGYIIPYKVFLCTVNGTETPLGTYKFYAKYRWKYMHDDPTGRPIYCQFLNRFKNGYIVHSLIYKDKADSYHFDADSYNNLGAQSSDGCVRLRADQAQWVYENCPNGTSITIYEDMWNIGPLDRPAVEQAIPLSQNYDPTDPVVKQ